LGHLVFMHDGEPVLTFQHERIHEWPPEGGVSSYSKALPKSAHSELMSKSIQLLKLIAWEGVAMVEYRYDKKSGDAFLMEINGRFWGSLPLSYHCGAEFSWLTYSILGANKAVAVHEPRDDLACMFLIPELKRLFRVVFQQSKIKDSLLVFSPIQEVLYFFIILFRFRTRYYVFQLGDPIPFFADLYFILKAKLGLGKS